MSIVNIFYSFTLLRCLARERSPLGAMAATRDLTSTSQSGSLQTDGDDCYHTARPQREDAGNIQLGRERRLAQESRLPTVAEYAAPAIAPLPTSAAYATALPSRTDNTYATALPSRTDTYATALPSRTDTYANALPSRTDTYKTTLPSRTDTYATAQYLRSDAPPLGAHTRFTEELSDSDEFKTASRLTSDSHYR